MSQYKGASLPTQTIHTPLPKGLTMTDLQLFNTGFRAATAMLGPLKHGAVSDRLRGYGEEHPVSCFVRLLRVGHWYATASCRGACSLHRRALDRLFDTGAGASVAWAQHFGKGSPGKPPRRRTFGSKKPPAPCPVARAVAAALLAGGRDLGSVVHDGEALCRSALEKPDRLVIPAIPGVVAYRLLQGKFRGTAAQLRAAAGFRRPGASTKSLCARVSSVGAVTIGAGASGITAKALQDAVARQITECYAQGPHWERCYLTEGLSLHRIRGDGLVELYCNYNS